MNDAADIVRDYLVATPAVFTLTDTRIWAELTYPPKGYRPGDGEAIVFKNAGGGFIAENALMRNRWQFKFYGASVYPIRALYLATMDALHDTRGRGNIISSQPEGPGTMLNDPGTEWPFMLVFIETLVYSGLPLHSPI